MKKLAIALAAAAFSTGVLAQAGSMPAAVFIGGGSASSSFSQVASFLANQLGNNRNLYSVSDSRVAVASFVNLTNIEETDKLGLALAENLMHEMHVRGFGVVDFKTREYMRVRQGGDFVFSREVAELRKQYNIHYFLSGTFTRNADGVVINARMIQADTGLVVSTGQAFLPTRDLGRLFTDSSRAVVEKVVVERPAVPSVRPNIVPLR